MFDAFRLVKLAPDPSDSNSVPAEFGNTTVGLPENCACGGACNLRSVSYTHLTLPTTPYV